MNKKLFYKVILLLSLTVVFGAASFNAFGLSADALKQSGWVNDFAGIIDATTNQKITALIGELNDKTTAEIAVVTIPSLEGEEVADFTNKLFTKWGVGKKGKDNGAIILVAVADRKIRIETGYGIEGVIPDGMAGRIIREIMTPRMRNNDSSGAIFAGTYIVASKIAAEYNQQLSGESATTETQVPVKLTLIQKIFSAIFMIIMLIVFIRHPWLFLLLLTSGRSGGGSGGGFGGGFGGFGGGSSGGGGASGGW